MKTFLFLAALAVLPLSGREGNFIIRFEPKAVLQTDAQIPFEINVMNDLRQPLRQAVVTLQIETTDHKQLRVFKAPETAAGVYLAKPVFPETGDWSVYVEVRRNDQVSTRTMEFNVPK